MFDLFRVLTGSKLVTADSCPREHVMREPDLYQSVMYTSPSQHSMARGGVVRCKQVGN